jgi:hypothetical protein
VALKPDQRAMLQLLLERGQSYDDLASVLGVENGEVRERARAALTELGGSDPDADVGLTDYLLGQADPIGRADAVRHLQSDPDTLALAEKIAAQLQLLAPDAELPELPRAKGRPVRAAEPAGREPRREPPARGAPAGRSRLAGASGAARRMWEERRPLALAILAALVAVLVLAVLLITGVIGGGDDDAAPAESEATRQGYPLSPLLVKEGKDFSERFPIPQPALAIAAGAQTVAISVSDNATLGTRLQEAVSQGLPVLDYTDESVLSGEVPTAPSGNQDQDELATIELEPVGDTDASGEATFGADNQEAFLDVTLEGLGPAPSDQTYVLWFLLPEGTDLSAQGAAPGAGGAPAPAPAPDAGGGGGGGAEPQP